MKKQPTAVSETGYVAMIQLHLSSSNYGTGYKNCSEGNIFVLTFEIKLNI